MRRVIRNALIALGAAGAWMLLWVIGFTAVVGPAETSPTPKMSPASPSTVKLPQVHTGTSAPRSHETRPVYFADCDSARAAGAAPMRRGEPGYRLGLDRNRDGVACE